MTIAGPGAYHDIDEEAYHADTSLHADFGPSLSSTGARTLLDSPARFRWEQDNPRPPKAVFDVGHAAHAKILGVGAGVVAYPDEHLTPSGNVSTRRAATEWAAEQRAAGLTPISPDQMAAVDGMAEAVLRHKVIEAILGEGEPEVSLYWQTAGVTRRARIDWLHPKAAVDLKTGRSADPRRFGKVAADYGYEVQADWYLTGLAALGYAPDLPFLHVLVEKEPPYLCSVIQLDDEALEVGHHRSQRALSIYAECLATDHWPAYSDEIEPVSLPAWHVRTHTNGDI